MGKYLGMEYAHLFCFSHVFRFSLSVQIVTIGGLIPWKRSWYLKFWRNENWATAPLVTTGYLLHQPSPSHGM